MPKGIPSSGRRAPRGSKMRKNIVGFRGNIGSEVINAAFTTPFKDFDEGVAMLFDRVITNWSQMVFGPRLRSSIRNSMWARSGKLAKVSSEVMGSAGGGLTTRFVIRARFPDEETAKQGLAQEFGRQAGGAAKGKYYMVPLASWVEKTGRPSVGSAKGGRPWKNSADITKDLEQDGVFWGKNYVATSAGPARMVYLLNKQFQRDKKTNRYRDPVTGRFRKRPKLTKKRDTLGRTITRGKLRELATAMYLAYRSTTGVYGSTRVNRKGVRAAKSPLAAQFGLTTTATKNSPMWFTRGAVSALGRLASAINNVRVRSEAMGKAIFGAGAARGDNADDPTYVQALMENAMDQLAEDVFDQIQFENEEGREPSEFEKKMGYRK